MKLVLFFFFKLISLFILPFILLIRGAVFLHEHYAWHPWFALLGGILISALVLFLYLLYVRMRMIGQTANGKMLKFTYWISLALVLAYCTPGLLFLSQQNAKTSEVRKEFTNLHPILRMGISTLTFLDKNLILTNASRIPEDYKKMGLSRKKHSLHYKQKNGYVHAVDIRTKGHYAIRNWLISTYFRLMGFNTLRHTGTADHLHVSLSSHDRPGGI